MTDAELEAGLAAVAAERWAALWAALDAVDAAAQHGRWQGGDVVDTVVVDGVERPVHQMPWFSPSEPVERLLSAIGGAGLVVPFDWMDWDGADRYRDAAAVEGAPVADAVRLVTAIVRSDRFAEGSIAGALDRGLLQAALRRIRAWIDDPSR